MEEKSERSRMGSAYITVMFAMLFLTIISVLLSSMEAVWGDACEVPVI